MRFNFKKISAIASSALLATMTLGVAAAANYPAPFVEGSTSDVAIVYGTGAGVSSQDRVEATNIADDLSDELGATGGDVTIEGDAWQVGSTTTDDLEMDEPINNVEKYIDSEYLELLADGTISGKGTAAYNQYLYFDDTASSDVTYTEDDDSNIGLFFKVASGEVIARYVMDFTSTLESDILSDNELEDLVDKDLTILGKSYTITKAENKSSGSGATVSLTLMSGAEKTTISNGETKTIGGKTITATVSGAASAEFVVDGDSTSEMAKGDIEPLDDGTYIGVSDIDYESFAGGLHQATIFVGADKIELENGSAMKINENTISYADVTFSSSVASSVMAITELTINMTAEDDLFVPVGGKLSENALLSEPEVLVSQTWDIEFAGIDEGDVEEMELRSTSSDSKYVLDLVTSAGDSVTLPIAYGNSSGLFPGDKLNHELVRNASLGNISRYNYFILNTENPNDYTKDGKSFVVQYKGCDKMNQDGDIEARFDILGVDNSRTVTIKNDSTSAKIELRLGGTTFTLTNSTSDVINNNFKLKVDGNAWGNVFAAGPGSNTSVWSLRTKNNALVTIMERNNTGNETNDKGVGYEGGTAASAFVVNVSVDDQDKDGEYNTVVTPALVFQTTLTNDTDGNIDTATPTTNGTFLTDNDNTDITTIRTTYGAYVEVTDTSSAPAQIDATIPESIVEPLVYVTSEDAVVSSGGGALGSAIIMDSEVSTMSGKNLIVVGGSCINSVAANLLGGAYCGDSFTDMTNVGAGEYLIESMDSPYSAGKIALLVAGYSKEDTVAASTFLRTQTVDTTATNKYVGSTGTNAELVVEEA